MARLRVDDWDSPTCVSWVEAIEAQVSCAAGPPVVVAHSIGCLAFAHWAAQHRSRGSIRGALLVAVPDPDGPKFPARAQGFSLMSLSKFPWPSILVSSQDDPYGSPGYARSWAAAWGSVFVDIGRAGHINGASNVGDWPDGRRLLEQLRTPSKSMWQA